MVAVTCQVQNLLNNKKGGNNMNTIWTLLFGLFFAVNIASAQDTLYIYKAGTVLYKQAVAGVDSVTFYKAKTIFTAVTTLIKDTLKQSPVLVGGDVISDDSTAITERGVLYGLSSNLTVANSTLVGSFQYGLSSGGFETPSTSNGKITSGTGNGGFSSAIKYLLSNKTYYVRAYAISASGIIYGEVLKFNTKNYKRDTRRFDIANVWWYWGSQYTLFDLVTDEVISPNTSGNYDIWYSTNENPRVFQTTLTSSSYNTCYKFKTQINCQKWCDIHNGVLKP